jgi:hypothetical protein
VYETFHPEGIARLVIAFLMNLSILLIIWYFIRTIRKRIDIHPYFKIMFTFLIIWSLFTIFRSLNPDSAITIFGHYGGGWTWILPLSAVFGFSIFNWLKSFKLFGLLLLIVSAIGLGSYFYSNDIVWGLLEIMVILPVMFLAIFVQNRNRKMIVLFSVIPFLIMCLKVSRRLGFIIIAMLIIFSLIEYLRRSDVNIYRKLLFSSIIIVAGLFALLSMDEIYNRLSKNKEVTTDTRTFLYVEQFADTSEMERIFGRGAMGTYYSEYFEIWNQMGLSKGDSSTRWTNEVGYLHIILKGGYIMAILYLSILIPAAFLGIFKSQNSVARMCGYYILCYILIWPISFSPIFGAEYIFLWTAAGTAISSSVRKLTIKKVKSNNLNKLNIEPI